MKKAIKMISAAMTLFSILGFMAIYTAYAQTPLDQNNVVPGYSATNSTMTGVNATNTGAGTVNSTSANGNVTPGVPNTGAGGDAATNILLLSVAGVAVVLGAYYAARGSVKYQ